MKMAPFAQFVDLELAFDECRFILVGPKESSAVPHPAGPLEGAYALVEYYCCDPDCDCRMVVLQLKKAGQGKTFVHVRYDFDAPERGPYLDHIQSNCDYAEDFLQLVAGVLEDPEYVARCERHYDIVRKCASSPGDRRWLSQPAHFRIAEIKAERKQRRKAEKRRQRKG